jgi:multiple sugar transport system substrate-binding protein
VFLVSKFRDLPCFPDTVPDLNEAIVKDSRGHPPTKYNLLKDVLGWTTNAGYPGYTNAAIEEILQTRVLTNMFKQSANGFSKPYDAIRDAETECKRIFSGWRSKGLV